MRSLRFRTFILFKIKTHALKTILYWNHDETLRFKKTHHSVFYPIGKIRTKSSFNTINTWGLVQSAAAVALPTDVRLHLRKFWSISTTKIILAAGFFFVTSSRKKFLTTFLGFTRQIIQAITEFIFYGLL